MNPLEVLRERMQSANLWEEEVTLKRNEYLKVKGSVDTKLYLVKEGTLRIFVDDEYEEHTIRFGYKNDFIAALDSFITEKPSDLYIQALKKCRLQAVRKSTYDRFIKSSPENLELWQLILESFVCQQMERERDLLTSSPLERFNRVLKRSPQLFQEVPNRYIASYLRMTPETLSRMKSQSR